VVKLTSLALSLCPQIQALGMDKEETGFNLGDTIRRMRLDFYGAIRLINYIRASVAQGNEVRRRRRRRRRRRNVISLSSSGHKFKPTPVTTTTTAVTPR